MRAIVLAMILLSACTYSTGTREFIAPDGTVQIAATERMRAAYDAVVRCYGKTPLVAFEDITWYRTPGLFPCEQTLQAAGCAFIQVNRIYVSTLWDEIDWLLQHEIAHIVWKINGHPDDPFKRCGLLNFPQNVQ